MFIINKNTKFEYSHIYYENLILKSKIVDILQYLIISIYIFILIIN